MAYNYGAYGAAYNQQYAQPASYGSQQSSTPGYGQYGQSAYGSSASTTSTVSSTASTANTYGYSSATTTSTSQPAASNFNYAAGYAYPSYAGDMTSGYNATATNTALQAFQQSWYSNTSVASSTSANPQTTSTVHTAQPQQYGNNYQQTQYMQQYQQHIAAYQQYTNNATGNTNQQQGMFKSPQPVGTKPRTGETTQGKTEQQQTSGWGTYNQNQQRLATTSTTTNRTDTDNKNMWGTYQQQSMANQSMATSNQQQKPSGVVYRSPMKYPQQSEGQTQGYGASSMTQGYKSLNVNPVQGYGATTQGGMAQNYGITQGYTGVTQGYATNNQAYKAASTGAYNSGGFGNSGFGGTPNYGSPGNFNQNYGGQNYKGYGVNSARQDVTAAGRSPSGQKLPQRGMEPAYQQYQPLMQQGAMMGQGRGGPMGIGGRGRGGARPPMGRGSPMGGAVGYGGPGRPGPQDGPDIPPFPQAWHSQEFEGDWQMRGPGGYGEGPNRFNRGMQRGRYELPPQRKGMYNNNSRNARGASGTNRELWSPAGKKSGGGSTASSSDKESKMSTSKKEEGETVDKEKHSEIKSFLYAWLGGRHARPIYDIRQIGERPNIAFRCDLRVDSFNFVGVGKAASKKEAQTTAAWKFADYLVRNGDLKESDLPPKYPREDLDGEFGDVQEEADEEFSDKGRKRRDSDEKSRSRDRRGKSGGDGRDCRNRERERWGSQRNWDRSGNQNRGRPRMDIPPLMALPVGPWDGGPMGPPPMMPPPGMMEWGNQWDDSWGRPLGPPPPPMPMRPGPPPHLRRNQNEYWRRRDIEERMMDMSRSSDWQNPEDMFIHQMIRNQQEAERRHRGNRPMPMSPMDAMPGEWQTVAQARPVVTSDDRHVMAKHAEIYPQEGELKSLHRIVNTVEQALKLLSDKFVDEDHPRPDVDKKDESEREEKVSNDEEEESVKEKKEDEQENSDDKKEVVEKEQEQDVGDKKVKTEHEEEQNEENEAREREEELNKKEEKRAKIKILKRPKKLPKQVDTRPRVLCGVNRIGPLAKGLLISKDDRVDLALLCGEIPTIKLLDRIMEHIEEKLAHVDQDFKLSVEKYEDGAAFLVKSVDESSPVQVMVTLTAMALRKIPKKEQQEGKESNEKKEETKETEGENKQEDKEIEEEDDEEQVDEMEMKKSEEKKEEEAKVEEPDPVGMLPKPKMLDALACLRHTHWFQAKACGIQSCVILTRILRDLQRRDEVWKSISEWALEVLIYSSLISSEEQMSPGDACRRFLEVVSGAIMLPGLPGLQDPCEKTKDVLDCLNWQEREEITKSAQCYLRQLAFREIHKFLGMEKLPPTYKTPDGRQNNPHRPYSSRHSESKESEDRDRGGEMNNIRKRRFEHNGDSVAESPKRSLTDEEDTDTQQNLAELSISDEASEGRSALEEADGETKDAAKTEESPSETEASVKLDGSDLLSQDVGEVMEMEVKGNSVSKEDDALLEDEKMDT